jgi:peptide deformylase
MSKLDILTYPNTFLIRPAKALQNIDGEVQEMIKKMTTTMYEAPGVGLAAVQVGWDRSLFIYNISPGDEKGPVNVIINPKIVASEGEIISEDEGCLSVPDFRANVRRAAKILVEGVDHEGKPLRIDAEGYLAIVLQHEIDHLNGTLFIDRISALKRELYKRRMKKKLQMK